MKALEYCLEFIDMYIPQWFDKEIDEPLFILISGPQGAGKTYTTQEIYEHLQKEYPERNIVKMSIDDFYLTHEDQLLLQKEYPNNKLLQGRGLPGTHDMKLMNNVLQSILQQKGNCNSAEISNVHSSGHIKEEKDKSEGDGDNIVCVPCYDKSKFNGEGDRLPETQKYKLPIDIVLFEGWFLGFTPTLDDLEGDMIDVNAKLFMYNDLIWNNPEISSLGINFATNDIKNVYNWRLQQEHDTIKASGSGMTDEEVVKFVDRYMPCYKLYYPQFIQQEKLGSVATLTLGLDIDRNVYSMKNRYIE